MVEEIPVRIYFLTVSFGCCIVEPTCKILQWMISHVRDNYCYRQWELTVAEGHRILVEGKSQHTTPCLNGICKILSCTDIHQGVANSYKSHTIGSSVLFCSKTQHKACSDHRQCRSTEKNLQVHRTDLCSLAVLLWNTECTVVLSKTINKLRTDHRGNNMEEEYC